MLQDDSQTLGTDVENQPSGGRRGRWRRMLRRLAVDDGEVYDGVAYSQSAWYAKLLGAGLEENGIKPVPAELRKETAYNKLFTVFFTCLLCILP